MDGGLIPANLAFYPLPNRPLSVHTQNLKYSKIINLNRASVKLPLKRTLFFHSTLRQQEIETIKTTAVILLLFYMVSSNREELLRDNLGIHTTLQPT